MIIIYEFFNEEYEFEVPDEIFEKAIYKWFSEYHNIDIKKAEEIIIEWDLMDMLENEIPENDIYYDLYQECEEMALNSCIASRDIYGYYGVNEKDFA